MKDVIARFGIRIIIGKGGMGSETLQACSQYGCVYVQVAGGAAQFLGQRIVSVEDVHFLKEFGPAEAVWQCTVRKLPGIVTMDTHGRDLYADIRNASRERQRRLQTEDIWSAATTSLRGGAALTSHLECGDNER